MPVFDSLALALAYLERHFWARYIFPIKAGAKFPPCVQDNLASNASNDPAQIAEWAKKFPGCNWGLAHRKSGVLVADVDCDPKKNKQGQTTYDALDLMWGWPDTEITTTPSGGHHHIYLGEHIMALGENGIGKDIDSPNYTLLPGCVFKDGTSYVGNDAEAVACPQWIYDTIKNAKVRSRISNAGEIVVDLDKAENIDAAKDFLLNDAEPAIEGSGGDFNTLKTAMYMKDLGISDTLAVEMMNEFYNPRCDPPWAVEDLTKKVANAYNYSTLSKVGGKTAEADFADDPPEPLPPPSSPAAKKARDKAQQDAKTRQLARETVATQSPDQRERIWTRREVIDEWVYVSGIERFVLKENTTVSWKRSAFDAKYAYLPAKKDPKSFAECLLRYKKDTIARFDEVGFRPGLPTSLEGGKIFNLYTQPDIVPAEGDIEWWNEHLEYLFPDPEYRDHVLNWMAWLIRNLTLKPKHALIIQGPEPGTGKSFIAKLLTRILHKNNVSVVSQSNLRSDFNGWALHAKLLVIEELRAVERAEVAQNLHDIISEDTITINRKNVELQEIDNCFGILAMTNHEAALMLDNGDRRYLIVKTDAFPRVASYYDALYAKLDDDAAVAAVAYALMRRDLGTYSGQQAAPATAAKAGMLEAGASDLEIFMDENRDSFPLSGRVISVADVVNILPKRLENRSARLYSVIKSILMRSFDAVAMGQCPIADGTRPRLMAINGKAGILAKLEPRAVGALYEADKNAAGKNVPLDLDAVEEFGDTTED